jgi:hypothetical protein
MVRIVELILVLLAGKGTLHLVQKCQCAMEFQIVTTVLKLDVIGAVPMVSAWKALIL